jgi:hypothetical protein
LKNQYFVVVDKKEGKAYDGILPDSLVFSPDSEHTAYAVKADDKQFVVVDGLEGKHYDAIFTFGGGRIIFNTAQEVRYLARKDKNQLLNVAEKFVARKE